MATLMEGIFTVYGPSPNRGDLISRVYPEKERYGRRIVEHKTVCKR